MMMMKWCRAALVGNAWGVRSLRMTRRGMLCWLGALALLSASAFDVAISDSARAKARAFMENEKQFQLGFLPTEQSNPITATLEEDFRRSTVAGLQCLQRADRQVPITLRHVFAGAAFTKLVDAMVETVTAPKGRIVFSGCGATGRLSILLESLWRDFFHRRAGELSPAERALADRSASIMTGGDFALIKSVESFEDSMRGGERQAAALQVGEGDTFVAITEGGETSSVLGTLRYAAAHGAKCFLVFNNPASILRARLDRCREAIDNPKVTVIDLYCGSMGLAGSTRMQATTSEQLLGSCALEAALCRVLPRFAKETAADYTTAFEETLAAMETPAARAAIAAAIDAERALYLKGGRVTYFVDDCMLDLFTDTTERSPTFMLPPFRASDDAAAAESWAFVKNPLHPTPACWDALFHRDVRCLEWRIADYAEKGMPPIRNGVPPKIGRADLMKYPIGNEDSPARYTGVPSAAVIVRVGRPDVAFEAAARAAAAKYGDVRTFTVVPVAASPLEVWKHLAVKLTFNNLSTGTMVAMGRVAGNWMSWVSISNKKLIDRGIRLVAELGRLDYQSAAERLFAAEEWVEAQNWEGRERACAVQIALQGLAARAEKPVEVRVRRTAAGPRLCVDGKSVRPRFYYGSPTCLCNIASPRDVWFNYPFRASEDTARGRIDLEVYPGEGPMDWRDAELVDETAATTNRFAGATHAKRYVKDGLSLKKDHIYRFRVLTRADHSRTYYTYKVGYVDAAGTYRPLPFPYGDTLGDATRLAAEAGVDIVTFSTDSSWGCEKWWREDLGEQGFARIDALMDHLIKINPRALLMPRVTANAPDWFLERHPEAKMKFDRGFTIGMSSVSYRPYREAACAAVERLARHLYEKYPRHFAGLHVSGQNSAEWFYMMSQSDELSGYDVGTRDAFRDYLKKQGAADWATAEVPSAAARRVEREGYLFDPEKDARTLDFVRFRNLEMATLLADIGAAVRRGTDGRKLSVFFYGYSWELGALGAGAGESGHYAMKWLLDNAADSVDAISAPMSYRSRNLTGHPSVMSAAETVTRRGILWINEVDDRTHREEIWDHMALFTPYADPWVTQQVLKRNSLHCILRGYGDWWMDLFGRGWHNEKELWDVRRQLNVLDDALLRRPAPYSPEVAVVLDEPSMLMNGWRSNRRMRPLVNRLGFVGSGTTYGQYLLEDFVADVPTAKLVYLVDCHSPKPEVARRLAELRRRRPDIVFVEKPAAEDLTSAAIAAKAKAAGCHVYTAPDRAVVEAAEGYVMVQAREAGELPIDFGARGPIRDALTGAMVGEGPVLTLPFRPGEVRVFAAGKVRIGRVCSDRAD